MITDAKKICEEKKKDIRKIAVNIGSVLEIEDQHPIQNPYLQKN